MISLTGIKHHLFYNHHILNRPIKTHQLGHRKFRCLPQYPRIFHITHKIVKCIFSVIIFNRTLVRHLGSLDRPTTKVVADLVVLFNWLIFRTKYSPIQWALDIKPINDRCPRIKPSAATSDSSISFAKPFLQSAKFKEDFEFDIRQR